MRHFAFVLFLLALCLNSTGCALRESGKKLMRFREGREPEVAPARQPGKYDLAYLMAGTGKLVHLPGTQIVIARRQPLGFKRDECGGLVAVAGHKEFTIGKPNMLAEYYCWYQRPRHDAVRDMQRFTNDSLKVAGGVIAATATVAIVGAALTADSYLDSKMDSEIDDDDSDSDSIVGDLLGAYLNGDFSHHDHHDHDDGHHGHHKKGK